MKKLLLLCVCTFMVANAALIPALQPVNLELGVGGSVITLNGSGDTTYKYVYNATLNDQAEFVGGNPDNEYFVLYDFSGFLGVDTIVPGPMDAWQVTYGSGPAFPPGITSDNGGPIDDPTVDNLLFQYVGSGAQGGQSWRFDVISSVGPGFTLSNFTSSAANAKLPGTYVRNWGDVLTPGPGQNEGEIPEPLTMGLLGSGLAAMGLLRRFRK